MSKISKLINSIVEVEDEVTEHDMEAGSTGGGFINQGGVYPTTIDRAFITTTKKGGLALNLHFGGANKIDIILYIVSNKNGKMITTCQVKGKTVSLPAFKLFKQLHYVATGTGLDMSDMKLVEETIKYKAYGKDVAVEADSVVDLIGKELMIGIRLEEEFNYEDGEIDKTSLKTDNDGNVRYKKDLESVFNKDGFDAMEMIKEATETKALDSKTKFLSSEKSIKRVKLEAPEVDDGSTSEIDEDEIEF